MGSNVAFVAGATGYTGREVVGELRRRGIETVAHVRPNAAAIDTWRARFGTLGARVDVTPWDPMAMAATLYQLRPTVVFALLGTTRVRAAREGLDDPYERIDYGLTDQLRRAAEACGTRPRFVYLSSLGAAEGSSNKYLQVRGRLERELAAGALPYLVARPAFVSGADREEARPRERVLAVLADALLGGLAMVGVRSPRDRFGTLSGVELGTALVELALAEREGRLIAEVTALRAAAHRAAARGAA